MGNSGFFHETAAMNRTDSPMAVLALTSRAFLLEGRYKDGLGLYFDIEQFRLHLLYFRVALPDR